MAPRLRAAVTGRPEAAVLALVLVATVVIRNGAPRGIYALGLIPGSIAALDAVAIVLIYRSSRVVNIAQISLSVLSLVGTDEGQILLSGSADGHGYVMRLQKNGALPIYELAINKPGRRGI